MKIENLLKKIEDTKSLTILDENGKKLATLSADDLFEVMGKKDSPEKLYSDIIEDKCSAVEIKNRAASLGVKKDARRGLYLLELEADISSNVKEQAAELLRELYGTDKSAVITDSGSHSLVLIHTMPLKKETEQLKENAGKALSMLNTELMIKLRVSYGSVAGELGDLLDSYREARFAMDVMKLFYEERLIADYASLGIGGLVNDLSRKSCERFLAECFGNKMHSRLNEEELQMVTRCLEKDLNISETARELYLYRNTLVYHLEKLQKKTGLDIRHFDDAMRLKLALMVEQRHKKKGEQ